MRRQIFHYVRPRTVYNGQSDQQKGNNTVPQEIYFQVISNIVLNRLGIRGIGFSTNFVKESAN